jgi:hypothetical protein
MRASRIIRPNGRGSVVAFAQGQPQEIEIACAVPRPSRGVRVLYTEGDGQGAHPGRITSGPRTSPARTFLDGVSDDPVGVVVRACMGGADESAMLDSGRPQAGGSARDQESRAERVRT